MSPCPTCPPVMIALEGLDGVGKSTLAHALAAKLDALHLTTPGLVLRPIRPMLDAALTEHPAARQLFYAATVLSASARAEHALAQGQSVVIDRYWLSTWVYQGAQPGALDLGILEARLRRPDLTVYVFVSPELRRKRLEARGMTPADICSLRHDAGLRQRYETALTKPIAGPMLRLDSSHLTPGELADAVLGALGRMKAT